MVFNYYKRLTAPQRRAYDKSDAVTSVKIPNASELHPLIKSLEGALTQENREVTESLCQRIISELMMRLKSPNIIVKVLAARPHNAYGELYGLYNPASKQFPAVLTVWMRTAQRRKVVAFRTFLRTLLHEICHHLDYEYFRFPYSFHTEGFYKRESSIFHQLANLKD